MSRNRIHGRLQSVHWNIPKSRVGIKTRQPLHEGLRKLALDLESQISADARGNVQMVKKIAQLSNAMKNIDRYGQATDEGRRSLEDALKLSYDLFTSGSQSTLEEALVKSEFSTQNPASKRTIRRVDKLGRYWGLCIFLPQASRKYPTLFLSMNLQVLPPYTPMISKMGFVPGQKSRCLVHAEMRVLTFYGLESSCHVRKPRIIGVSKSCCYLCNLFINLHGQHFVTKTHGRLYERWNFPDVADFEPTQLSEYRRVLTSMDETMVAKCVAEIEHPGRRIHPMDSWLALPPAKEWSPVSSTVVTNELRAPASRSDLVLNHGATTLAASNPPNRLTVNTNARTPSFIVGEDVPRNEEEVGGKFAPSTSSTSLSTVKPSRPEERSTPTEWTGPPTAPAATAPIVAAAIQGTDVDCSSVQIWEYPIHETITEHSPFQTSIDNYFVDFEIEGSTHGEVFLSQKLEEEHMSSFDNPVTLGALKSDEILHFDRRECEDDIVLLLGQSGSHWTQVRLRWMPN